MIRCGILFLSEKGFRIVFGGKRDCFAGKDVIFVYFCRS